MNSIIVKINNEADYLLVQKFAFANISDTCFAETKVGSFFYKNRKFNPRYGSNAIMLTKDGACAVDYNDSELQMTANKVINANTRALNNGLVWINDTSMCPTVDSVRVMLSKMSNEDVAESNKLHKKLLEIIYHNYHVRAADVLKKILNNILIEDGRFRGNMEQFMPVLTLILAGKWYQRQLV